MERVSSVASKYLGRPISQLPSIQPIASSSLDLHVGGFGGPSFGPSLDLDLLPGNMPAVPPFPFSPAVLSEVDKSEMADIAANAMEELIRMAQTDEPLWMKPGSEGREKLNLDSYDRLFPRSVNQPKSPVIHTEASRASCGVMMGSAALVDMFMDSVIPSFHRIFLKSITTSLSLSLSLSLISFLTSGQVDGAVPDDCY